MTISGQKSQEFRKMCNPLKLEWIVNIWHKLKSMEAQAFSFKAKYIRGLVVDVLNLENCSIILECIQLKRNPSKGQ